MVDIYKKLPMDLQNYIYTEFIFNKRKAFNEVINDLNELNNLPRYKFQIFLEELYSITYMFDWKVFPFTFIRMEREMFKKYRVIDEKTYFI